MCTCSYCHRYPLEDYIWWFSSGHEKKQCNWRSAAFGGQKNWKAPNSLCDTRQHGPPHGVCGSLISALKLLANQQKYGDSPVKMVVQSYQERIRLIIMDGLLRFIMVENHEAVKVGDLQKNMESKKVVRPKFTTHFQDAVIREGADELTLRAEK